MITDKTDNEREKKTETKNSFNLFIAAATTTDQELLSKGRHK